MTKKRLPEEKVGRTHTDLLYTLWSNKYARIAICILIPIAGYFWYSQILNHKSEEVPDNHLSAVTTTLSNVDTPNIIKNPVIDKSKDDTKFKPSPESKTEKQDVAVQNNNYGGKQINVQENNGIIGDYNTVNVQKTQRILDPLSKQILINQIDSIIKVNNMKKTCRIEIVDASGTSEAHTFAYEILQFLNTKGYVTWNAIDSEMGGYGGEKPKGAAIYLEDTMVVVKIFDSPY